MTVVCAVDLGLRSCGVAWDGDSDTFTCPPKLTGGERLRWWADTFAVVLLPHVGKPVGLESAFMHPGRPTGALALAELHGVFKLVAHNAGCEVITMTPAQLKKASVGRGNATKDDMVAHARWLRPGATFASHDECDAVCLLSALNATAEGAA